MTLTAFLCSALDVLASNLALCRIAVGMVLLEVPQHRSTCAG